ncbi:unnamed protein product, partial [Rangifer tarandus platyrhynchus]
RVGHDRSTAQPVLASLRRCPAPAVHCILRVEWAALLSAEHRGRGSVQLCRDQELPAITPVVAPPLRRSRPLRSQPSDL